MSSSIRAVFESGHLRLLDPVDLSEGEHVHVAILKDSEPSNAGPRGRISARELMKLPLDERNRILAEQASIAETHYRNDPDLTDFEVFDDHDLHDETP
jgi:predicted DNA-binding antitoxin AbrB/MazE fold protein